MDKRKSYIAPAMAVTLIDIDAPMLAGSLGSSATPLMYIDDAEEDIDGLFAE